jgi:uncharacterized protein (TIRG00374 family)
MKTKIFQALKILLPISLGIYLVVYIYGQLDSHQRASLFTAIKNANYFWVALSFGMGLLSHYIRGYRWKYQIEAMGYESRVSNNFMAVMIGYIVNMALPRVGEVSRAAAISKYSKIPFQKSFGSILSERAVDLIILLGITVVTLFLQYNALRSFSEQMLGKFDSLVKSPWTWAGLVLAIAIGILVLRYLKKYRHIAIIGKFWSLVEGLVEGLRSIFRMKNSRKYLLATAAIWILYVGMFWVCFFAVEETSSLGISAVFAGFVVGSFAVALIPGGIGAYPVGVMQALALYGVSTETGFALGWIIWISQTAVVVIVGGICLLLMPFLNKRYAVHANA